MIRTLLKYSLAGLLVGAILLGYQRSESPVGGTVLMRSQGGTATQSYDPNDDRIYYWRDASSSFKWLDIGTNLSITDNTLNAAGVAGGTNSNITFLTVGNTASLSFERSLTATLPLVFTDGGVNSTYDIGLAAGYSIGLTASQSAWEGFYDTPSGRITAGSGFAWSTNTFGAASGYSMALTASQSAWETLKDTGPYLALAGGIITGAVDAGGATSFEMPNGTAPTVDAVGEFALDTTDNQFIIASATSQGPLVFSSQHKLWGATIASTSIDFVSGGRIWLPPLRDGFKITEIWCAVDGGTSKVINISNSAGTTDSDSVTCDANGQSDTAMSANAVYAAGSLNSIEMGAVSGEVDYVTFTVYGTITRE